MNCSLCACVHPTTGCSERLQGNPRSGVVATWQTQCKSAEFHKNDDGQPTTNRRPRFFWPSARLAHQLQWFSRSVSVHSALHDNALRVLPEKCTVKEQREHCSNRQQQLISFSLGAERVSYRYSCNFCFKYHGCYKCKRESTTLASHKGVKW